jgi:hypothetical protein
LLSVLLPSKEELIWLLLLVYYLPELTPELQHPETPAEPLYQKSEHFSDDYIHAKRAALELANHLVIKDSDFGAEIQKQEECFLKLCSDMHGLDPRSRIVKNRSFHMLCRGL